MSTRRQFSFVLVNPFSQTGFWITKACVYQLFSLQKHRYRRPPVKSGLDTVYRSRLFLLDPRPSKRKHLCSSCSHSELCIRRDAWRSVLVLFSPDLKNIAIQLHWSHTIYHGNTTTDIPPRNFLPTPITKVTAAPPASKLHNDKRN